MAAPNTIQSLEQAPAQPSYVLRGHSAQIHAVHFLRDNTRLLTGDADGFVVLWNTATKRAVAVWKPHSSTILGLESWDDDKIITHGRDNKLCVWQLTEEDEPHLSKALPISEDVKERRQPWLLHSFRVHSLNFCSFAMIPAEPHGHNDLPSDGIFVATPGVQDGHINVTSLPDEDRIATIPSPQGQNTGMVMAIGLQFQKNEARKELIVVAGYESGQACIWQQKDAKRHWQLTYMQKSHTQPVLSLSIAPTQGTFFTSSADAIVARHPLTSSVPTKTIQTKHAGQQGLVVRSDERIFATAGWDGRMRVYSVKSMKELAVLKWHKEGCYALAFANLSDKDDTDGSEKTEIVSKEADGALSKRDLTVSQQRAETAKSTHWLAAGSQDGKVSLWDIY
ncbi:ASTRA-associated 1 [Lecanosticta acicola]|uniref:ASTRA-associated protein 1 n=1 Tax=Lecanosticta acicola TaxID=111012 RepID=A0AAI8YVS5_9PEZI|nr:ASTRA-associated 1 [Lecanosticta acicola]